MKKFLLSIFAVLFAFAGAQAQETVTDKLVATSFAATSTSYTNFTGVIYKGKTVISEIWGYEGAGEYEWVGLVPTDYSFEWGADIATVTEDGDQYTITGVFMDYTTEEKYEVMITTAKNPATALENVTSTVAPVKAIVNGQLVIVKDGVQYNAQGAVVK